jgi:hypothetical protein
MFNVFQQNDMVLATTKVFVGDGVDLAVARTTSREQKVTSTHGSSPQSRLWLPSR